LNIGTGCAIISNMRILIIVLLGLATVFDATAQAAPASAGNTNAPDHAASGRTADESHRLEAGDLISFQIREDKKPPMSLVVTDSGEVHAPYVGRVDVFGKTCREVAAELKVLLETDYYKHATVIVGLDTMSRVEKVDKVIGQVIVWGEVRNPGAVDIRAGHTLKVSEAILRVGGLTDSADKKNVKIIRTDEHGAPSTLLVNLHNIMDKGKTQDDVPIKPGDYIIVDSRLIRF